jgi:hypothetical protein
MPLPRGRKSLPTMFSRTEDFPDDCEPTTTYRMLATRVNMQRRRHTICGRSSESLPMVLNTKSCSLLTVPSRSSPREAIWCEIQRLRWKWSRRRGQGLWYLLCNRFRESHAETTPTLLPGCCVLRFTGVPTSTSVYPVTSD